MIRFLSTSIISYQQLILSEHQFTLSISKNCLQSMILSTLSNQTFAQSNRLSDRVKQPNLPIHSNSYGRRISLNSTSNTAAKPSLRRATGPSAGFCLSVFFKKLCPRLEKNAALCKYSINGTKYALQHAPEFNLLASSEQVAKLAHFASAIKPLMPADQVSF